MEEIWKSIDGFENYMVSNYGKLKRIYKNKITKQWKWFKYKFN